MTNKEIRQYVKTILPKSHCPYPARKKLYAQIYGDIQQYLDKHPGCSKENLYDYFGSPEEGCCRYITDLPPETLHRKLRLNKLSRIFLVCLCTIILFGGLHTIYVFYNTWKNPGYMVITSTTIEMDSPPCDIIQKYIVSGNPRTLDDFPFYNVKPLKKAPAQ